MLRFDLEWQEAPGVRDRILSATWARLVIALNDDRRQISLTRNYSTRSSSLHQGVYGSAFLLTRWVVQNWWFLLHEPPRGDQPGSARAGPPDRDAAAWYHRHNLLTARDGFALPDLSIYRDGPEVVLASTPDPPDAELPYPVLFEGERRLGLAPGEVEAGLRDLVISVLDRLAACSPDEPEYRALREDWQAICSSSIEEARLCSTAAAMGVDPYEPSELTDGLLALFEDRVLGLEDCLRLDLAEATTGQDVLTDISWLERAREELGTAPRLPAAVPSPAAGPAHAARQSAHELGYARARRFRQELGLPPGAFDLEAVVRERCGWAEDPESIVAAPDGVSRRINALVGRDSSGRPRLMTPDGAGNPGSRRFRLGRALFFAPSAEHIRAPRLLTRSVSWDQRASRAFAAELLVPAEEMRRLASGTVTFDEVEQLAGHFGVSTIVIEHQLKNHRIASVIDL